MTEHDAALRAEVQRLNSDALIRLMAEHNIVLKARDFPNWRPTKPETGTLIGLDPVGSVRILCTDGVLAIFLRPDGQTLYGHLSNFDGKVQPLHSVPSRSVSKPKSERIRKPKTASRPKSKKVTVEDAIRLLEEMIEQHNSK